MRKRLALPRGSDLISLVRSLVGVLVSPDSLTEWRFTMPRGRRLRDRSLVGSYYIWCNISLKASGLNELGGNPNSIFCQPPRRRFLPESETCSGPCFHTHVGALARCSRIQFSLVSAFAASELARYFYLQNVDHSTIWPFRCAHYVPTLPKIVNRDHLRAPSDFRTTITQQADTERLKN